MRIVPLFVKEEGLSVLETKVLFFTYRSAFINLQCNNIYVALTSKYLHEKQKVLIEDSHMLILFNRFISDYSTEMIQPVTNELNLDVKVDKLYK